MLDWCIIYNTTKVRTIGCTPTEANKDLVQSMFINNEQEKTQQIEDKDFNIILAINAE